LHTVSISEILRRRKRFLSTCARCHRSSQRARRPHRRSSRVLAQFTSQRVAKLVGSGLVFLRPRSCWSSWPAQRASRSSPPASMPCSTRPDGRSTTPPLHVHHGNTRAVPHLGADSLPFGGDGSLFGPARSRKFAQLFADFAECQEGVLDFAACAYQRFPDGAGYPVPDGTALLAEALMNLENVTRWQPQSLYIEYGRVFELPAAATTAANARKRTEAYDFALVPGGHTFHPSVSGPKMSAVPSQGSIAWHVWRVPRTLRLVGSWFHSHSSTTSELLVLSGNVEDLLPAPLVSRCYDSRRCCRGLRCCPGPGRPRSLGMDLSGCVRRDVNGIDVGFGFGLGRFGSAAPRDLPLAEVAHEVQPSSIIRHLINRSAAVGARLRCHYKSRNVIVNGTAYDRSAARSKATAKSCDSWIVAAGSYVSMLSFHYPLDLTSRTKANSSALYPQHHRWYASLQLADQSPQKAHGRYQVPKPTSDARGMVRHRF